MECNVYLGGPSQFELQGAILVYTGGNAAGGAFAAWHESKWNPFFSATLEVVARYAQLPPARPDTRGPESPLLLP